MILTEYTVAVNIFYIFFFYRLCVYRTRLIQSNDPQLLEKLYRASKVVLTPSKNLPGNRSSSYDDRTILKLAAQTNGAIISNDNYSDLLNENDGKIGIISLLLISNH